MKNHFSRYVKFTLCVFVFILTISLTFSTGFGQKFNGKGGLKAKLVKRAMRFNRNHPRIRAAIQAQEWHNQDLFDIPGVIGTAVGVSRDQPTIRVYTKSAKLPWVPKSLDGFPVEVKVAGKFVALQSPVDPTAWFERPVPIGVSTGHPAITAGTIGCRVTDGTNVFALSNNHVYAAENNALLGDKILQPGVVDGGNPNDPDDLIGTLYDFVRIDFCPQWFIWVFCNDSVTNTVDAAIALSSVDLLSYRTPDDGYGTPTSTTAPPFLEQSVMKYGRTTGLTRGTITAINAKVDVGYSSGTARFVNQIIVENQTTPVIGGGDSGSLLVTDPEANPVGLMFAGNETGTVAIANQIDEVLNAFGVSIDGGRVDPVTDVAITSVSAPASVVQGSTVDVDVTVENLGNQDVGSYDVTLTDMTDGSDIGIPQEVSGLAAGASTTLTYSWNTTGASVGSHTLEGSHNLLDDVSENDSNDTAVNVVMSLNDVAVTAVSAPSSVVEGNTVGVDVTVENLGNQNVGSFDVTLTDMTDGSDIGIPQEVSGLAAGVLITLTYSWNTTGASVGSHALKGSHDLLDDDSTNNAKTTAVDITPQASAGPILQTLTVTARTDTWTTVPLDYNYGDEMVVVCSPNYDNSATGPAVVRLKNASGDSFEVGLGRPWYGGYDFDHFSATVHCMVVTADVYTEAEHGVKMEAVRLDGFTSKDDAGSWIGVSNTYGNTYSSPVVVGQVVSPDTGFPPSNCPPPNYICEPDWSVFWSRGSSRTSPPSSSILYVGRHTGEDRSNRAAETLMYVVIEAGIGAIEGRGYVAALGADTIRGMQNNPPFTYNLSGLTSASTAIASQAGMDGVNGGWAVLYGSSPVTNTQLRLAIEEDWYWDPERRHTNEQVGYIIFEE